MHARTMPGEVVLIIPIIWLGKTNVNGFKLWNEEQNRTKQCQKYGALKSLRKKSFLYQSKTFACHCILGDDENH